MGGGIDPNLVIAYENGEWKNGFSASDFGFLGITQDSDYLTVRGNEGDGFYCQTDYTATYKGVRIKFDKTTTYNNTAVQAGISTKTATLPSIISTGTGRGNFNSCYYPFTEMQELGITLASGNGFYFGSGGSLPMRIYGIYFVKA